MKNELDAGQRVELDLVREEYYNRYGVAVEYLKRQVGPGETYENSVARAVVSSAGVWFECIDQPMEFSGAVGERITHRFVSDHEAMQIIRSLHDLSRHFDTGRRLALLLLYSRGGVADRKSVYFVEHVHGMEDTSKSEEVGAFQQDRLPLLFRCRFDTTDVPNSMPFCRGVIFGLTGIGERNLLVEIPYEGTEVRDLGAQLTRGLPQ